MLIFYNPFTHHVILGQSEKLMVIEIILTYHYTVPNTVQIFGISSGLSLKAFPHTQKSLFNLKKKKNEG